MFSAHNIEPCWVTESDNTRAVFTADNSTSLKRITRKQKKRGEKEEEEAKEKYTGISAKSATEYFDDIGIPVFKKKKLNVNAKFDVQLT